MMAAEPCLEFRIVPMPASNGRQGWTLYAAMPYVPATTVEGPWTGKRRDGLRALCVKQLDGVSPSFGASVEAAEVLHPSESETVMDPKGAAALTAKASIDLTGVPAWRGAGVLALTKGFCVLERSVYAGEGDAGLAAAAVALNGRQKLRADA